MKRYTDAHGHILADELVPSAKRTAGFTTPPIFSVDAVGVMLYLDITSASGTGGISLNINAVNPVMGEHYPISDPSSPITITRHGVFIYMNRVAGDNPGNVYEITQIPLPALWSVTVTHGDETEYEYSVGYSLIKG